MWMIPQFTSPLNPYSKNRQDSLLNRVHDIRLRLPQNFLYLNEDKSGWVIFGTLPPCQHFRFKPTLRGKPAVRHLGVTFDSSLKFDKQVNNVVQVSHFLLWLSSCWPQSLFYFTPFSCLLFNKRLQVWTRHPHPLLSPPASISFRNHFLDFIVCFSDHDWPG